MGRQNRFNGSPQDRFAQQALDEARRAGLTDAWYVPEQFAIRYRRRSGEESGWIYLHKVYAECAEADDDERTERLSRLISSVVDAPELPGAWEEVRPTLRPVLRASLFGRGAPPEAPAVLSRPALPYLSEFVVIDLPASMAYVTVDHLRTWPVPADEVFAAARANLAALGRPDDAEPSDAGPAMLRFVDSGDAYFTSRILLDGWLAGLSERVGGRPVAFVPDRATLLVVRDLPDALPRLFEMVEEEYLGSARSISPQAYTVADDGSVCVYPPAGREVAACVQRADAILASHEYSAQAVGLARDEDAYVAELTVARRPDGSVFTVASWAEGIESLLPRADYVAFTSGGGDPLLVPWSVVAEEVDLAPVEGLAPPRYRVRGWPDPPVMDRLRARASRP